jgi:ABC-type Na+ transport system ATPase subunit NatA
VLQQNQLQQHARQQLLLLPHHVVHEVHGLCDLVLELLQQQVLQQRAQREIQ